MSKARELAELSRTVSDSADAVAITIDASENVTFANDITVTGALTLGSTAITATGTELNYVDGVTSAIQTQLDAKAPLASPTFTGTVTATEASVAEFSTSTNVFESNVSGQKGARLRAAVSDAGTPTFSFHDDTNTGMYSSGADTLNFSTAGIEAYRITAAQDMYFGQISGSAADVGIILQKAGNIFSTVNGGTSAYFRRNTSDGEIIRLSKDGTTVGSIGTANSGDLYIGNDDTSLLFAGGSDAILPRGSAGATRDAAIDLGLSSHRFKDIHLSGGVNFSANANASGMTSELFSDYEIGTWTPSASNCTLSVGRASYTKVGRAVVLDFNFVITGTDNSSSGSFIISGVPFTASSANSETIGSLMIRYADFSSSTTQATLYHYSRTPTIHIYLSRDTNDWVTLKRNDFSSSSAAIIGTITLVVD